MRFLPAFLLLAILPMRAQDAKPVSMIGSRVALRPSVKIAQGTFTGLEKYFNQRIETLFGVDDPADLLGSTRGVYLDGYGAVFTTEASLVVAPSPNPFRPPISRELADSIRKRKIERMPFLKAAMKDMMRKMAATLIQVPADQQVVLIVRFYYQPWEDMNGMPSQILMRADRKSALAGQIQVEEQ